MRPIHALIAMLWVAPVVAADRDAAAHDAVEQRRQRLQQKHEQQFRAADRDGSRSLTREEMADARLPAALLQQFERIDADHDDALSPEELQQASRRRIEQAREGAPDP